MRTNQILTLVASFKSLPVASERISEIYTKQKAIDVFQ